jgi:hypothetical protein
MGFPIAKEGQQLYAASDLPIPEKGMVWLAISTDRKAARWIQHVGSTPIDRGAVQAR